MSAVNAKARSLLDAARSDGPSAADRARITAALAARLAPPSSVAPKGASASAKTSGASGSAAPALFVALTAGLLSGAAPQWIVAPTPVPVVASLAPVTPAAPATLAKSEPGDEGASRPEAPRTIAVESLEDTPPPRSAPPRRPSPTAASDGDSLAAELRLLRAAQLARAEDPARAVALLDELGARYPRGVLAEERMAARILALCAAGRVAEARTEGRSFLAAKPGSVQADRIRASCAFEKVSASTTERHEADH